MKEILVPGFYNQCLRYLLWLRLIEIGAQILVLGVVYLYFHLALPVVPVLFVIGSLCIITLWSFVNLQRSFDISEGMFFMQLVIDIAALAIFLYFTGGASNPFAPLFLLPVVVAAATLPVINTWIIAGIAVVCYTGLMFFHIPLHLHTAAGSDFIVHIWGMWIGFLLAAVLVAFFVSRIGAAFRQHDQALAHAREEALRTEQVLALGTLAAGTAHELGTPLATIAVVSRELEKTYRDQPDLISDLKLLRTQVERCKSILARMSCDAGQLQADAGRGQPLDQYLQRLIADWSSAHPRRLIANHCHGITPAPQIVVDRTLTQAIVNVLDNAAEVSQEGVEMDASWNETELHISVRDRGPGFAPAIADKLGQPFVTTKNPSAGMGLGLFLACTTLDRMGGSIHFSNADAGGSLTDICLPLESLLARGGI
jgi:two-component system sensor histidine kinase RegB